MAERFACEYVENQGLGGRMRRDSVDRGLDGKTLGR